MHQHVVVNAFEILIAPIEEGLDGSTVHHASEREIPNEEFGPAETDLFPDSIEFVRILEVHDATTVAPAGGCQD
jgi:hypothetical protein